MQHITAALYTVGMCSLCSVHHTTPGTRQQYNALCGEFYDEARLSTRWLSAEFVGLSTYSEPQGDIEQAIAEAWRKVLAIPRIGKNEEHHKVNHTGA